MSVSAWVMLGIGAVILYGGLAASLSIAIRKSNIKN